MLSVKIFGAGSIGNHLAHACRGRGFRVMICDLDPAALERTKNDIYPTRYGSWEPALELARGAVKRVRKKPSGKSKTASPWASVRPSSTAGFDLIIVGAPPESHIPIALEALKKDPPRALLIEKPLCPPSLAGCAELDELARATGTFAAVGYNHTLCRNTFLAEEALARGVIGSPLTIQARVLEHWGGIFGAHPWLAGPQDSYLGFWSKGGGACGEHSHSVNIFQHFAHILNQGRVVEVRAMMDMVSDGEVDYDRLCQLLCRTESGLVGSIIQDVITEPAQKYVRIQGDSGWLEWRVNKDSTHDAVSWGGREIDATEELIAKTRPDDFAGEIEHLEKVLAGQADPADSPISLKRGLESMLVIAAAYRSHQLGRAVAIDYEAGWTPAAIQA